MNNKELLHFKTRIRSKGQVTLPKELRELLTLSEGDDLEFYLDESGRVIVQKAQTIPPDQAWFWTERWQKMEREVEEDIAAGRIHQYETVEDALDALGLEE